MNNFFAKYPYLRKWQTWLVVVLLLCTLSRFWKLDYVKDYIFDEVYHGFTAKMFALDRYEAWVWWTSPPEGVAYEWTHPPLAKVIMSWGIDLFGGAGQVPDKVAHPEREQTASEKEHEKGTTKILANWSFGWRVFSAVFGVFATLGLFLFVSSIFKNKWIGVIAAFLFTFDLLPLVQSRVAMNDIFAVTFMIYAFYFFTRRQERLRIRGDDYFLPSPLLSFNLKWYYWLLSSIFIGCAIASKWTALFALGLMGMYQGFTVVYYFVWRYLHKNDVHHRFNAGYVVPLILRQLGFVSVFVAGIPFVIYLLSYWQLFTLPIYDYQGNSLYDIMKANRWSEDAKNIQGRLDLVKQGTCTTTYSAEFCNKSQMEKDLKDAKQKQFFWGTIYSVNQHFADRLFIWWGLQQQMWWYHTNLKATHAYQSQWWQWPLDLRPVWFYVKYCDVTNTSDASCNEYYRHTRNKENAVADVYTMGNPIIFWLIFPALGYIGYLTSGAYRKWFYALIPAVLILLVQYNLNPHSGTSAVTANAPHIASIAESIGNTIAGVVPQIMLFGMLLLLFLTVINLLEYIFSKTHEEDRKQYFIPLILCLLLFCSLWLPWARSPRIMFFYHFFPPMTFFYPLLAFVLYRLFTRGKSWRNVVIAYLCVVAVVFVYFFPHVTGEPVPSSQRESYFWLGSWK
jgi:dolichyl-phosphate-mannose--protein O-mannosyl transferase